MRARSPWMCVLISAGSLNVVVPELSAEIDAAELVSQLVGPADRSEALSSLFEARRTLRSGSAETKAALRTVLCERLSVESSPRGIRRICLALSAEPSDDAIGILVARFGATTSAQARTAICHALRDLVREHAPRNPETEHLALNALEMAVRAKNCPRPTASAAVLAMAAYGSRGFDLLVKLRKDSEVFPAIQDVYYTALGETGDPRALAILREAVSRAEPGTGRQIQSVRAIGQCFAAAARTGLTINASERHNCALMLQAYLDDETPDQAFSVALRSLGRIQRIDEDERLRSAILKATSSVSDLRREAAMMVLYSSRVSLDDEALGNIRSASESDPSLVVRQVATAVLEKHKTAPVADQHQN